MTHQHQFNAIASAYTHYVGQDPFRLFLHYPAIVDALRTGAHKRVLDIGCGDGRLGEILSDVLQSKVEGYDVAPAQIEAALKREAAHPRGNSYSVARPESFTAAPFDAAVSVMVLPYAENLATLDNFFRYTHPLLEEERKFVSVVFNPRFTAFDQVIGCRRFERFGSDQVRVSFLDPDGKPAFTSVLTQFDAEAYRNAAHQGGFNALEFRNLEPALIGKQKLGPEFWQLCERVHPYSLMTATKGAT